MTAFRESRRSNWYTAAFYGSMIGTLRSNGRPAYLQEPNSTRDATYQANDRPEYCLQALPMPDCWALRPGRTHQDAANG